MNLVLVAQNLQIFRELSFLTIFLIKNYLSEDMF